MGKASFSLGGQILPRVHLHPLLFLHGTSFPPVSLLRCHNSFACLTWCLSSYCLSLSQVMRVMELNSSFVPLHWPEDLPQRHMAVTAGTGAVGGFLTGKAVCTRIILFGSACIRTQNVNGSSIHKQAIAYTYSCHSARVYTTAPITHTATLLLELPVSPHGNLSELKI